MKAILQKAQFRPYVPGNIVKWICFTAKKLSLQVLVLRAIFHTRIKSVRKQYGKYGRTAIV